MTWPCCLQVSLKREHGLDAKPGAQEQVAYRRKEEEFGDEDKEQSDGGPVCICVCVCGSD